MKKRAGKTQSYAIANVRVRVADRSLDLTLNAPTGSTPPTRMLPVLRSISASFVGAVEMRAAEQGHHVSCTKGCGACCRQLVPIAEVDARNLSRVVAEMPSAQRKVILDRFAAAKQRFARAGLLDRLQHTESISDTDYREFGLEYFRQGVACPFLEDESCSIHTERPLVCREYLVVSPAEYCSRKTADPVHVLRMPAEVSRAARGLENSSTTRNRWVPLILALEWTEQNPSVPSRPGEKMLEEVFQYFKQAD